MDNGYQLPRVLVPLASIAFVATGIYASFTSGFFTSVGLGFLSIAAMLLIHRAIGGLWGTVWAAWGLVSIPILAFFAMMGMWTNNPSLIILPITFVVLYLIIRIFKLHLPDAAPKIKNEDIALPLTPSSYIQRAAQRIEQVAANTNTIIDDQNIFIYRNNRLSGLAWAFPDGAALQPNMVTEIASYRRELGLPVAALIAPTFNEEMRVAAGQHRIKLISV
jgi:hypothetical protein